MKQQLLLPMAFYVSFIWCLAVYMFRSRVKAIRTGEVSQKYFKTYTGQPPSDRTLIVGRHYDNQFQVPLLFFVACIVHMQQPEVGLSTVILAWMFVAFRMVHSWVHLGSNILQRRVGAFAAAWIVVLILWAQLVVDAFIRG